MENNTRSKYWITFDLLNAPWFDIAVGANGRSHGFFAEFYHHVRVGKSIDVDDFGFSWVSFVIETIKPRQYIKFPQICWIGIIGICRSQFVGFQRPVLESNYRTLQQAKKTLWIEDSDQLKKYFPIFQIHTNMVRNEIHVTMS